jgi:hypothetical protein
VAFDTRDYPHLEHGYAATVHKAQGVTVDRAYVLASPHFDRHTTYVALTRHREEVQLHYNREDFATVKALESRLARAQAKDMAVDYRSSVAANVAMERPRHIERSFAQHTEHAASRQAHVPEQARSRHDTSLRAHEHEQPKWLAAALSQQAAAQREQAHGLQQPALQARPAVANETGHGGSLHEKMQTRMQEPAASPVGHDRALRPSSEQQGLSWAEAQAEARTQAQTEAACKERILNYKVAASHIESDRAALRRHAPPSAKALRDSSPAMRKARQACTRAQQDITHAKERGDAQDYRESVYRHEHPMRAGLGLEAPRHAWAQERERIAAAQAAAQASLAAAERTRSQLMHDPALRRRCEHEAAVQRAAYMQQKQAIEARAAQLAERASAHAADQRTVRAMREAWLARQARIDAHKALTYEYNQERSQAQTKPMTFKQAIERQPAVVRAREACHRAQNAYDAAERRQAYAEHARRNYETAHPIKAAFGLNDGHSRAVQQAAADCKQAQRQLTQTQERLDDTRGASSVLRDAKYEAHNHNLGIKRAQQETQSLGASLARQAQTYRTDCLTREADDAFAREQRQSQMRERDCGMER